MGRCPLLDARLSRYCGFLRTVLRTVNIPVVHEHQGGHALPHFSADGLHLSHGDDPYTQYTFADPSYPMSELLIKQSTFDEWFGSDVPDDARKKHVRKRVMELGIHYPPHGCCVITATTKRR